MLNKKEQKILDDLQQQLRMAKAFRFTEPVEPDVLPPEAGKSGLHKGFLWNEPSRRVVLACTTSFSHSFGHDDKTDQQNACPLYSTRLLALRALRRAMEDQMAIALAKIDEEIEKVKSC